MAKSSIRVLLVEDSPANAVALRRTLAEADDGHFAVDHAEDLGDALSRLGGQEHWDVILLDLSLGDSWSLETISTVQSAAPQSAVVVLTGVDDEQRGLETLRAGAQDYLVKAQTDCRVLARSIHYAIERKKLQGQRERLVDALRRTRDQLETRVCERTAELQETVARLEAEVAARTAAEGALRESQQRYRTLFESSPSGVCITDYQGRILEINRSACEIAGYKAEEMLGQNVSLLYAEPHQRVRLLAELRRSGAVRDREVMLKRKDGSVFWGLHSSTEIELSADKVILTAVRDITRRKGTERSLREVNELLERMFDSIHLHVAYMDRDFNFLRVNRAYALADGRDPAYFVGKNHFDLYPNAENEAVFREVVRVGEPCFFYEKPFEYASHPERGVTYWDWSLQPVKDAAGKTSGVILSLLNATDRVHARQRLEAARTRFFSVLHMLPGYVILEDADHNIQFANRVFVEQFGDPQHRRCYEILHARDRPCRHCRAQNVLKSNALHQWEWRTEGGRTFHVWAHPFHDVDGQRLVMHLGIDVTERKALERQVLDAAEAERRRIGQDLHDVLGQNLTGIAFLSKVLAQKLEAEGHGQAGAASEIARQVNEAIGRTRAIARGLCPAGLTSDGLVSGLGELAAQASELYGVRCEFRHGEGATVEDGWTAAHLYSVVGEAVSNAVRHGKSSNITISLDREDDHVVLAVADDGVGLPDDIDSSNGLGMHTMQYRCDAVGAVLEIKNRPSGGTVVACRLPKNHKRS